MAFGRTTRHPDFPDIPIGREMTQDPKALALISFAELPFFMALPFAAPPGIPADRAKALQSAFMDMSRDKEFVAEAEKIGIDMSPLDGAGILQMLIAHRRHAQGRDRALYGDRGGEEVGRECGALL